MNIITENYIWFIISGIVILLITIGYYADKTNFGKKKLSEATADDAISNEDEKKDTVSVVPNNVPISDMVSNSIINDDMNVNINMEQDNLGITDMPVIQSSEINQIPNNEVLQNINISNNNDDSIWKF